MATAAPLLVVLDIGKSNAKIVLLDPASGAEIAVHRRPNASVDGVVRQLDLAGLEAWLLDTLALLPERDRITALVPVTHGASCVMLDQERRVLFAPDYEDPVLAGESADYDRLRDPFALSLSPGLPAGLNVGRQIHFVQASLPDLFGKVGSILTYPQYWAYLLCGIAASEVTSLGCHTDLWFPASGRFSDLAEARGWARLFPAVRRADDILGVLRPELAARCGLPADCVVLCGIHDSNASYLRHRMHRARDERFSVVSSGTWTVLLASFTPVEALQPDRDMLANVDAFGALVGTARFMGGREYQVVAGVDPGVPSIAGLRRAVASGATVRPGFSPGGQFPGRVGRMSGVDALDAEARASLASLYIALLTDSGLDLLHSVGDLVIDGPLAQNPLYPALLAALRPESPVFVADGSAGTIGGAQCLLLGNRAPRPGLQRVAAAGALEGACALARQWLREAGPAAT